MMIEKNVRERDPAYLSWVAKLPCAGCLANGVIKYGVQVAHLRSGSLEHGKQSTGMATKPSDAWCTPLCVKCHLDGPNAQHRQGEMAFWEALCLNPFDLCLALSDAYAKHLTGAAVLAKFCGAAKKQRTAK